MFPVFDKQAVTGKLKSTGSRDIDVLYTTKSQLVNSTSLSKIIGTVIMIMGGIQTITILLSPIGIPFFMFGWWLRGRATKSVAAIESAYADYIAALG